MNKGPLIKVQRCFGYYGDESHIQVLQWIPRVACLSLRFYLYPLPEIVIVILLFVFFSGRLHAILTTLFTHLCACCCWVEDNIFSGHS